MGLNNYPPSPTRVPADLLKIPDSYKLRAIYVIIAIALFVLFYLAMVAASAYLVYLSALFTPERWNKLTILLKLGAIAMSVMLFVFTLKFLFSQQKTDYSQLMEIKPADHPELFAFIEQICKETGAPRPKKVYLNPEINAAVFYDSTILSLFLPVKKNLLIGLGLVNSLNLTEFKAVLAHEFGHFAQSTMKLGSYTYMANKIIHDMVYNRDQWDNLLAQWQQTDLRLAIFGWILGAVVFIIRNILGLVYKLINRLEASLSRQMEFNADLVAVSVTGSDAIINGLHRLEASSAGMGTAQAQLSDAADHKLYTKNLFYHQRKAEAMLKAKNIVSPAVKDEKGYIFSAEHDFTPPMYASHPSNFQREQNAKARIVEGVTDDRSPWILFNNPEAVQEAMTAKILKLQFKLPDNTVLSDPEVVDAFIQAELEDTNYHEQYQGCYDSRLLTIIDPLQVHEMKQETNWDPTHESNTPTSLYGPSLKAQMERVKNLETEMGSLVPILTGQNAAKTFQFRGHSYPSAKAGEMYEATAKELEEVQKWWETHDKKVFLMHWHHAENHQRNTLSESYRFQNIVIDHLVQIGNIKNEIISTIQQLNQAGSIDEHQMMSYTSSFNSQHKLLQDLLNKAKLIPLPKLNQLEDKERLQEFIQQEPLTYSSSLELNWVNTLLEQIDTIQNRLRRLYFKNLSVILKQQEAIMASQGSMVTSQ